MPGADGLAVLQRRAARRTLVADLVIVAAISNIAIVFRVSNVGIGIAAAIVIGASVAVTIVISVLAVIAYHRYR